MTTIPNTTNGPVKKAKSSSKKRVVAKIIVPPEVKKYNKTCKACGVNSLTELRFISKSAISQRKGIGRKTEDYIKKYLSSRGFSFGSHTVEEYNENKNKIWADATGVIVFKYKIRSILPGLGLGYEWAIGEFAPDKANFGSFGKPKPIFRNICREEAKDMIAELGLVPALETSDGVIYDSPDKKFFQHFGHKSSDLSGANNIYVFKKKRDDEEEDEA
jgi:hypothetical protein